MSKELQIKLTDMIGRESMCDDVNAITGECNCEDGIEERARRSSRNEACNIRYSNNQCMLKMSLD